MSGKINFLAKADFGMKVSKYFKKLVRRFFNISPGSNFTSNLGWHNAAPAAGFGKYKPLRSEQPDERNPKVLAETKKYTSDEVKAYLRGQQQGERARPVLQQASQFSVLLQERMRRHFRGRERIFDRFPYVLYQYTQGRDATEIARSVSYFADADDIEQAMDFAATLIANQINRSYQRNLRF